MGTQEEIYIKQIETFENDYSLKKIQSASDNELQAIIKSIKNWIERLKIPQEQYTQIVKNPKNFPKQSKHEKTLNASYLQTLNRILLHLETMLKFAVQEDKKFSPQRINKIIGMFTKALENMNERHQARKNKPHIFNDNQAKKENPLNNNRTDNKEIPRYLLDPKIMGQLPDKALNFLIESDYDENKFEKIVTDEGKNMILLSRIENITSNDILNIRSENFKIVFSLRMKSGNIASYDYDELIFEIDQLRRSYETTFNLSHYYLTMTDEERTADEELYKKSYAKTPEKEKQWQEGLGNAEKEIEKLKKLEYLLWQSVEQWKAGVWKKPSNQTFEELKDRPNTTPQKIIVGRKVSKPTNQKRKRRTKLELETLTPKVVEEYQNLYDNGKYNWEEIFKKLESKSKKLFGKEITSGSLQGIYNRRKKYL